VQPQCTVLDCDTPAHARGLCSAHYARWYAGQLRIDVPEDGRRKRSRVCSVDGCNKPARYRGWCGTHYTRWKRHGDPLHVEKLKSYPPGTLCAAAGCERPARTGGYCKTHYGRLVTKGDIAIGRGPNGRPVEERFWNHITKDGPLIRPEFGPCWGWTGKHSKEGYGHLVSNADQGFKRIQATHVAWRLATGEDVPDGMRALHVCDNPGCTRNDDEGIYRVGDREFRRVGHLFLGTDADNTADMTAKKRGWWTSSHASDSRARASARR
jgi:hypothetical protein